MCILCIQANPFITRSKDIHISPSQVGYVVFFLSLGYLFFINAAHNMQYHITFGFL